MLRFHTLDTHPVRAVANRVAHLGMLELRENAISAVHVEAEQVLDPVVRVRATTRRGPNLGDPGPDARGRCVNVDCPCRDAVRVFQKLIAGEPGGSFLFCCSPGQDRCSEEADVYEAKRGGTEDRRREPASHAVNLQGSLNANRSRLVGQWAFASVPSVRSPPHMSSSGAMFRSAFRKEMEMKTIVVGYDETDSSNELSSERPSLRRRSMLG